MPQSGQDGFFARARVTGASYNLQYSAPGVNLLGPKRGADIVVDANKTVTIATGNNLAIPAGNVLGAYALTLSTAGATTGELFQVSRIDASPYQVTVNGQALTADRSQVIQFRFNGSSWVIRARWRAEDVRS